MPSSTAARKGATATKGQVPRQRSQPQRTQSQRTQSQRGESQRGQPERSQEGRAGRQHPPSVPAGAQPDRERSSATSASPALPWLRMPQGRAGQVLWWGGLATVAAFGMVDWPVAALVGIGTWVAEQQARQSGPAVQRG